MSLLKIQEEHSPTSIWLYYTRAIEAVDEYQTVVLRAPETFASFIGMTRDELFQELEAMRSELDIEVTMALISSFEAIVRVDFSLWIHRKRRGDLRRVFSELNKRFSSRVPFEDILDAWEGHVEDPRPIGKFKQLLQYRHWIAHGRCWVQKSGVNPDPEMAWNIAAMMFQHMPGFEEVLV